MLTRRCIRPAWAAGLLAAAAAVAAHTVDLEQVVIPNACSSVHAEQANAFARQTSSLAYGAGRAPVSVVLMPTKPMPEDRPDAAMTRCAQSARAKLPAADFVQPTQNSEEQFRNAMNTCLAADHAGYEVRWVVLRRGAVKCP